MPDHADLTSQIAPLIERGFPFLERMGLRLDHAEPGRVRLSAPLEGNGNHIGTMYAGALYTVSEVSGGALFLATFDAARFYPIVVSMEIEFLRAARTDVCVEVAIDAEAVRRLEEEADALGKAPFDLAVDVVDSHGTVVCRSTNRYQMRRHGS